VYSPLISICGAILWLWWYELESLRLSVGERPIGTLGKARPRAARREEVVARRVRPHKRTSSDLHRPDRAWRKEHQFRKSVQDLKRARRHSLGTVVRARNRRQACCEIESGIEIRWSEDEDSEARETAADSTGGRESSSRSVRGTRVLVRCSAVRDATREVWLRQIQVISGHKFRIILWPALLWCRYVAERRLSVSSLSVRAPAETQPVRN
jgi:hypothetical protein